MRDAVRLANDVHSSDAPLDSWAGDWRTYRLRFFDHVLEGATLDEPPVRVFVMGGGSDGRDAAGKLEFGGRWISAHDWPLPVAKPTAFQLHNDGRPDLRPPHDGAAPTCWPARPTRCRPPPISRAATR